MNQTLSRNQRLRALENRIRKNLEEFMQTGADLREIRDDRLYEEDGFESWEQYLTERVGEEFGVERAHACKLIQCAEIRPKLPDLNNVSRGRHSAGWSQKAVLEFSRLVPEDGQDGRKKDYSRLRKQDAARVAKRAMEMAGDKPVTSSDVRRAVDADLGIDRAAKAKETRKARDEADGVRLEDYLRSKADLFDGIRECLAEIPAGAWELLEQIDPGLVRRVATAAADLTAFLRTVEQPAEEPD